ITQEDCWTVISSFFEQKGLIPGQQLDSSDGFVPKNSLSGPSRVRLMQFV
ncbi:hypothetical protein F5880DRAFT_1493654, partial [Lentinula raphanica]